MKADPRTSILSGFGWLQETIDTPGETYTMLRMSAKVFFDLHDILVDRYGLKHSPFVSSYESLAMFLWILRGCESNRRTQNISNIQQILFTTSFTKYSPMWSRWQLTTLSPRTPIFALCILGLGMIEGHIHISKTALVQ